MARKNNRTRLLVIGGVVIASLVLLPAYRLWWSNPEESGALIVSVDPDGPAAAAGLRRADVIVEVNGTEIAGRADLFEAISDNGVGDELPFVAMRGDDRRTGTVTVADRDGRPYVGLLFGPDGASEATLGSAADTFGDLRSGKRGGHRRGGYRHGWGAASEAGSKPAVAGGSEI